MTVVVLIALTVSNCRKETEKIIERVEVQKGNQILSGNDVPTTSLGSVGDYYLNKTTMELYGPKTTEGWGNAIGLKGAQGEKGKVGATILSGITAPTTSQGKVGDWYIDTQNKHLYGPKTESGLGTGISLISNSSSTTQKTDFLVSDDGTTLLQWRNKNSVNIDMTTIPELANVTKIGNGAFTYCSDLTSIKLSEKITLIGHYAFSSCDGLTELHIPKNITKLGSRLLDGSPNIKDIYVEAITPPTISTSWGYGTYVKNIYVPASSLNAYKNNAQWKKLTDIIEYDPNTHQQVVTGSKLKAMP